MRILPARLACLRLATAAGCYVLPPWALSSCRLGARCSVLRPAGLSGCLPRSWPAHVRSSVRAEQAPLACASLSACTPPRRGAGIVGSRARVHAKESRKIRSGRNKRSAQSLQVGPGTILLPPQEEGSITVGLRKEGWGVGVRKPDGGGRSWERRGKAAAVG